MIGRGCKSMQRLISASLDGELSPEDEQRLQAHLDDCLECRQTRDAYRANRDLIHQSLPDNTDPPQYLTDEILRKTREISNATGIRRLILGSRLRLTMSAVATIAVVIIASSFFLVQNYRNGIRPSIASSNLAGYSKLCQPDQVAQNWGITDPVRITFSKPMNQKSVLSNLLVNPSTTDDQDRPKPPTTSWDGNTLIIGESKTAVDSWTSGTLYLVTVMQQAQDTNGNPLGTIHYFCFHTNSSLAANDQTTPPTASATSTSAAQIQGTKSATEPDKGKGETPNANGAPTSSGTNQPGSGQPQNQTDTGAESPTGTSNTNSSNGNGAGNATSTSNSGNSNSNSGNQGTETTNPPANGSGNTPDGNAGANSQSTSGTQSTKSPTSTVTTTSSATTTPTAPAVTPTPKATTSGTATSTETATSETATPTGSSDTSSSTSTSTSSSTATSTSTTSTGQNEVAASTATGSDGASSQCPTVPPTLKMPAAFGSVYWPNPDVCKQLGAPKGDSTTAQTIILTFQRGVLIERSDTKKVYILQNDGTGGSYTVVDAPSSPSVANAGGTQAPSDNLWIPGGDLGKVWTDSNLKDSIGYATSKTADSSSATPVQEFKNGSMVYSDAGFVYVLYNGTTPRDDTWQVYPDTSGHGALLTPTAATPDATQTVTPTPTP